MLEQLDQNSAMASQTKQQLYIHHTNLFQPHKLAITGMAQDPNKKFLAITRKHLESKDIGHPFTLIEIYQTESYNHPKYVQTIFEYEDITAIDWLTGRHIMTVSLQATVNIYHMNAGCKIKTMTTDFGPITCMKYSRIQRLLITGTESGYVATYRLGAKGKSIELISKMVKINDPVGCIDFYVCQRLTARKKNPTTSKIVLPGKRKRNDTSDEESESDNEDDDVETFEQYLDSNDITIYGTSASNVICWDFHKKTIVETMVVGNKTSSLVVLHNGDIAVGDANGHVSIFDQKSFTCRQNLKAVDYPIISLTRGSGHRGTLLVTGQGSAISLFKPDKTKECENEYVFFEKLGGHKGHVLFGLFESSKTFYTSSADGSLHKFRLTIVEGRKSLKRFTVAPDFANRITFAPGSEVMVNQGKSLTIYKLMESIDFRLAVSYNYSTHQELKDPQKLITLKVGAFVHSATLDNDWICYATRKRVSIHSKSNLEQVEFANYKLPNCHILQLCCDGQFLVAGQQKKIFIIRLSKNGKSNSIRPDNEPSKQSENQTNHKVLFAYKTKGIIKHILHHKSLNQLVVTCSAPKNYIYTFNLPAPDETGKYKFSLGKRILLPDPILHVTFDDRTENDNTATNLYIYTTRDQLIRFDGSKKDTFLDTMSTDEMAKGSPIRGLPGDANILGLLVISRDHCIIYDKDRMFKVDIEANKIINETTKYKRITTMDKSTFDKPDEILVVSTVS